MERFPKGQKIQRFQKRYRLWSTNVRILSCIISAICVKSGLFGLFWRKNTLEYQANKSKQIIDIIGSISGKMT